MQVGLKHSTISAAERADELAAIRKKFGTVVRKLRTKRSNHTLRTLGEALDVSAKYLSEIENGLKMPEDALIAKIAREFRVSESSLFKVAKRIPVSVQQVLTQNSGLAELVYKLTKADAETVEAVRKLLDI